MLVFKLQSLLKIYKEHGFSTSNQEAIERKKKSTTWLTPEDLEQFINLRVPRKQWSLVHHLSKYTAHRPHINRSRIVAWSKQYFGCSVPQGHHLGRTTNVYEPRHNNERWYQKVHQTNSSYVICGGIRKYNILVIVLVIFKRKNKIKS